MNPNANAINGISDRFREIPYNYTSFSDKEIVLKYFDQAIWEKIEYLRTQRVTGRSAKLLYDIIGDIFVIQRNPYLFEDFLKNNRKLSNLSENHAKRLSTLRSAASENKDVLELIDRVSTLNDNFLKTFAVTKSYRKRILFALTGITSLKNIHFSPFHRIFHATDATDWRVEYPFLVVYPDSISEVPKLITAAGKLGLSIIPRGGGTGLTGGAVPVNSRTMVINTEKLSRIGEIGIISEQGMEIPVIDCEAGVVTDDIIEHCSKLGYIFATDPTSSWASTIGGNIAENAGGKKCVMWGTAIDNLFSYSLVNSHGDLLTIKRRDHPYRKILPDDEIYFDIFKNESGRDIFLKSITLTGTEVRKKGLGKDITNKVLNGLPGVQKEGGDGVIVSAKFVLYKPFRFTNTVCIEFFGTNMNAAARAIIEINSRFIGNSEVHLTALEHFDEKYVNAINYRNKSARTEIPKAVLIIDIESNENLKLEESCKNILSLIEEYNAEGIKARDLKESAAFWNDRKHLGAIAKHTNAFKLNEDIVIPVEKLPDFADFIELMNYRKEFENSISAMNAIKIYLQKYKANNDEDFPTERSDLFFKQTDAQIARLESYLSQLTEESDADSNKKTALLRQLQCGEISFSFETDIVKFFRQIFNNYSDILSGFESVVSTERSRKLIIATHMHAGDGNVHVNIPVHSSDYMMMLEADECAGAAMNEATRLGGVISGEHGIGLTKLKYIDKSVLNEYREYKNQNDPTNLFNPGKLESDFPLSLIYTPSFNLLEREAIILRSTELEELSLAISSCVRCGKCKPVCNTHYPEGTMMYNPRNKILAIGLITEAVLFSAQTLDMKSFKTFKHLRDIADYCTVCHKCQKPCPVKIDFGEISLSMRKELVHRKKAKIKTFTTAALFYLGRKKYRSNRLLRFLIINVGYSIQRTAAQINKPFAKLTRLIPLKVNYLLNAPFPKSKNSTLREKLKLKNPGILYAFQNPNLQSGKSVVYFPGCGSERMFPEISLAAIALLYNKGIRVVIPPEFLCCGYPFFANGKTEKSEIINYENKVLFHKIADTIGYLNLDAVVVSCGTCLETLEKNEIGKILFNSRVTDINEYIVKEKLFQTSLKSDSGFLYHEPCHNPLKMKGYEHTFENLFSEKPVLIPNCCGEAGTLALSRPDISSTLTERKRRITGLKNSNNEIEILTTCPSCVMGLSKLTDKKKVSAKSLVVFSAETFLGKNWLKEFLADIRKNGVEEILF